MSVDNGHRRMGCIAGRINLTTLMILTLLLEPKLFTKIPMINSLYIVGAVFVFCMVVIRLTHNRIKVDKFFVLILIYRASMFPQTVLLGGEILDWGYYTLTLLALVGYFESLEDDKDRLQVIDNTAFLVLLYLSINLLALITNPAGLIEGLYFLGYRTRIVEVFVLGVVASAYVDCWEGGTSFRTLAICIIGLIQMVNLWVATALVGLGVFAMAYLALCRLPNLCRPILFQVFTCLGFLLTAGFCFFNINLLFSDFIQNVLHKSATLSDRMTIWAMAIEMIKASPLFGYGIVDNGNHILWMTSWNSMYWQAHNNILQILLDGGLFSLCAYSALLVHVGSRLKKTQLNVKFLAVILAAWFALNVMSVSEIFVMQNYFFLFLLVIFAACDDPELNSCCHLGVQSEI